MSYTLSFELPGLPHMANASGRSRHWRIADNDRKKWQSFVTLTVSSRRPPAPLRRYTLTLVRHSSVEPDYDGVVRGFKSIVDALVRCGVLAGDKMSNTGKWDCDWIKSAPKKGKISVIVTEVKEEEIK